MSRRWLELERASVRVGEELLEALHQSAAGPFQTDREQRELHSAILSAARAWNAYVQCREGAAVDAAHALRLASQTYISERSALAHIPGVVLPEEPPEGDA